MNDNPANWLNRLNALVISNATFLLHELGHSLDDAGAAHLRSVQAGELSWCGYPPASAAETEIAAIRLGCRFPKSYVDFLKSSNGFSLLGYFAPKLSAVEDVNWLREIDPALIRIREERAPPVETSESRLSSVLAISGHPTEFSHYLVLDPLNFGSNDECPAGIFTPEGLKMFESFDLLMAHVVDMIETVYECIREEAIAQGVGG